MLMNFALDVVGTSVVSDKVSTDGHEVSNLIHTDYGTRKKGYLAEHFVKPPVHVTFSLPCNINISHVVMEPYIGQQQSMQLELLCAHKPPPRTVHGKLQHKFNVINSHNSSDETYMPAFHSVSKITCSAQSPVCFYNPRFTSRLMSPRGMNYMDYQNRAEMRHAQSQLLTCASQVMVKVTRTLKSSTPALNGVEIWGCVSSLMSNEVRQAVEGKYLHFVTPKMASGNSLDILSGNERDSCKGSNFETDKNTTIEDSDSFEIPEDFLDPITCEVMTIPMLLPCGKNIDKTSLDKFSNSEAMHGRRPRDPFTGVEFSDVIKPIPNVDLKSRIDAFLMSNSSIKSISRLPRTVGKGESNSFEFGKRKRNDNDQINVSSLIAGMPKSKTLTVKASTETEKQGPGKRSHPQTRQIAYPDVTPTGKSMPTIVSQHVCGSVHCSQNDNISKGCGRPNNCGRKSHNAGSGSCSHDSKCFNESLTQNASGSGLYNKDSYTRRCDNVSGSLSSSSNTCNIGIGRDVTKSEDKSHDARLKESLDSALFSVLATTENHSHLNRNRDDSLKRNQSGNSHISCAWCGSMCRRVVGPDAPSNTNNKNSTVLYATPCQHLICRCCLLEMGSHDPELTCKKCGSGFQKKDVARSH